MYHCYFSLKPSLFQVRVGSTYYDKEGTLITKIASIIFHKRYQESTYDYDVALIKVRN